MLWLLALVPAFLLAYYRGWRGVSLAFGAGMAVLVITQLGATLTDRPPADSPLLLLVIAAYVGITLGIGWLTEMLRDVVELQRREEEFRRLAKALETMQVGVTITDTAGRILYANPADARQHGYAVAEVIGQDVGIFASGGSRKPLTPEQLRRLSSWRRESSNVRRDGSGFPVHLRSDVVLGRDGEPIGVVTTCEDITDRRASQERLQEAYGRLRQSHVDLQAAQLQLIEVEKLESVGRLAAGVAHEVKNPLMTLLTGVKYLSTFRPGNDPEVTQLLDDMRDAVLRADAVIRGLLDFSAPHALALTPQSLNAVVERALPLLKHEAERAQVVLSRELAHDLPEIALDGFKIQQVLINLITNAAHATPPGGRITVRTSFRPLMLMSGVAGTPVGAEFQSRDSAVFVEVDDTGSGIPPAQLGKVFDPFFTTKPTGKGTGLGLSVARQIVELHGGTLHLDNRPEGGVRATLVFKCNAQEGNDGKEANSAG
ncbi:MAG: ATP-binding protein [Gemmatimonadales bacterium]|nr:ATP-binding protein [Gemmatimonadales bacterium]